MPALVVSYAGLLGGAERILLEVADGPAEPPLIACPPGPLADAARARGLGVFELRERGLELRRSPAERVAAPARLLSLAAELRPLVAAVRPDVLVAWNMRALLALATAFPAGPRPRLVFQHNDLLPGALIARAVERAAKHADRVIALSHCSAQELGAGAVDVLHPGVDLERFCPDPQIERHPRRVLLLGALEPWKRPDLALEAVALAARELPDLELHVAGEPLGETSPFHDQLRRRAAEPDLRDRVTFAGRRPDPERALHEAGCLLHCAAREPYGLVVAEALACGTPVVVPDSCGPAEIAGTDCGRLYPPGSAPAAAEALVSLLRDPGEAAAAGAAGRARAERELDVRATRARWAELVAAPGSGRPQPEPEIAVITVLHDSRAELSALLASLERHLPAARLVVVDSGSSDGGPALAREWRHGAAEVVELGENVGFGRAANAGLARVEEPVTVLLNPDCELLDASLAAAAREALREPARLIAPLVLRSGGRREDSAQRVPGDPALLAHALLPGAGLPRPLAAAIEPWRSTRPRRVGWAVGSCVVARTELLRRLGPFDERTFMYAEDLDLGLRAADAGVETWFWPAARVLHHGAHSSRRVYGGEPYDLLARRRREVVRERRGSRRAAADDLLQLLTFADRLLLKRALGRDSEAEKRRLQALRRARREARGA